MSPITPPVVMSPDTLASIVRQALDMMTGDFGWLSVEHVATGVARVTRNRVRINDAGETLTLMLDTRFNPRVGVRMYVNQVDPDSLRDAIRYLEMLASCQRAEGSTAAMPRTIETPLPNTTWHPRTAAAMAEARHAAIPTLVQPMNDAGLTAAAFVGVYARSFASGFSNVGVAAANQETDTEVTLTGWGPDGRGSGWAGQAARDWAALDLPAVAREAVRLTRLAANPVALEPGRRTAILGPPAVAQIVHFMGYDFDARGTFNGATPLWDPERNRTRLHQRIFDPRIMLSSDPSDPEGGYLPFSWDGTPLIPMQWVDRGVVVHLGYDPDYAAQRDVHPSTEYSKSVRLEAAPGTHLMTIDEMIANCKQGVYVNRFALVQQVNPLAGIVSGVTSGGTFLVRDGKIEKPVKDFRFVESAYFFLNRLIAIGPSIRAPFGYSPMLGNWPIEPIIVPPLMVGDFDFVSLAEAI